ncbi:MAG TPA: PCMD domain-containing protein [Bacteroidetes bacterium]|nr:PCMD domain-containing protein [Bacteroidota bacterium]
MKTTKYLLSALCLAALAAGCTKDSAMRTSSVEGLRISVTAAAPSTRTALHEDGLTVLWEEGDQLLLISNTSENTYPLTLDKASLSEDSRQADFVASQAIPEGEYYLASSNVSTSFASSRTIMFNYGDKVDRSDFEITVTDPTKNTHEGGLKTMALLSDKFTVSEGATSQDISVSLKHYSTLLEFPILLTSNTTGTDVTLNSVTISSSDHVFNSALAVVSLYGGGIKIQDLSVILSDAPVLPVGEPYKVYMAALTSGRLDLGSSELTITVSTSAGDYTFTKPGKALEAGYRYTLGDLNIDARPNLITNEAEWNQAIAEGKTPLTLGADVELTASATLPTYDVTVTGDYTLTINADGRTAPLSWDGWNGKFVASDHGRTKIDSKLTLTGGADLAVKNGYLYLKELEVGDGSELSGVGGRLVISYALTVTSGASATIASSLVASCDILNEDGATLTVDGKLFYDAGNSPSSPNIMYDSQLPYSNFDNWFKGMNDADVIGESGSSNNVWDTGNGNESKIGTAMTGYNPTTPETTTVVAGKACKMFSVYINYLGGFVKKFAAGNVYLGELTGLSGLSGAKMTFGIPSEGRLPVAVTGYYNYQPGTIDYIDNEKKTGGTDSMDLYIALATKQYSVDTNNDTSYPGGSASDLANDPNIVAYGRLTSSETTGGYSPFYIELTYKDNNFIPSGDLYLLITATSSKGGAQFTGSTKSVLYLDELSLEF